MPNWKEAIFKVLQASSKPMHYTDIAEAVTEQDPTITGATPARTAYTTILRSLRTEADNSPFVRLGKGLFALRQQIEYPAAPISADADEAESDTGLINAFGMYWSREKVLWTAKPRILGQQQQGSSHVDFCEENGVYLLHDGRAVVYVGRTLERPLGLRLKEHTVDRLSGRWSRFSWFGVYPANDDSSLDKTAGAQYTLPMLIVTMEALLIEGLEPPQNRKRGDDFKAAEFMQVEDPEIQKKQIMRLMDELRARL